MVVFYHKKQRKTRDLQQMNFMKIRQRSRIGLNAASFRKRVKGTF